MFLLSHLFVRGDPDFMNCLLDSVLGSGDSDDVTGLVHLGDGDLGCSLLLKILKLGATLAKDVLVMLLGDGNRHIGLGL